MTSDDDPVVDDPVWLRNEVRRQRGVLKDALVKLGESAWASEKIAQLEAEVERLRAELAERASPCALQDMFARLNDTESSLAAANALLVEIRDWPGIAAQLTRAFVRRLTDHLAVQPATAPTGATCDSCKRNRCDCYERDCDKCHWPGSPNCRRAGPKP